MSSSQSNATIFSLQSYITELTCYINENNAKYTNNLETLKNFYETQVQDLQQKLTISEEENLQTRNNFFATRDLLNNRQKELNDLKTRSAQNLQENQSLRKKLYNQRQKIDHLYEEMELTKKQFKKDLDEQEKMVKQVENQKNEFLFKLKEREQEICRLNKEIERLQDQVSERYSLPEKLKDIQIQAAKNKTLVQSLTQSKRQLQTKLDFQANELQGLRKQNKRLEVNYETRDTNAKKQLNEALTKERQLNQEKQKRLETTNEKQLFQITELQNSLKAMKKENSELQNKLNQYVEECRHLQEKILNHDLEKDRYIDEFQKLKKEYEEVIKNLEDAIPKYQKKNWDLEQQNRDLNVQLDGLRDLLNEVRAMNTLQPLKQEFRKIAQLQLLAQKNYKSYKAQETYKESKKTLKGSEVQDSRISLPKDLKNDDDFRWDKLLAEIDNIQVS